MRSYQFEALVSTSQKHSGPSPTAIKIARAHYRNSEDFERIEILVFDEIEKASDALWNLLLGILTTLALGDNQKVDFSRAMIFMTGNLCTAEMSALMGPESSASGS